MLKIRLQRTGRKHEPTFRLVLTDSQNSTKSGKYLERLGYYDPRRSDEEFNSERIKYWISVGAKPTDTVHNLLISKKIIEGKKVNVLPRKSPVAKEMKDVGAEKTEISVAEKETEVKNGKEETEEETGEITETPLQGEPPTPTPAETNQNPTLDPGEVKE